MTDKERIDSILAELEHGYIGYDNLHGDDEQGRKVIEQALKRYKSGMNCTYYGGYLRNVCAIKIYAFEVGKKLECKECPYFEKGEE